MDRLNLQQAAQIFRVSNTHDGAFRGVCVDSRLFHPGNLFFALPGACSDGHLYLQEVALKGCAAAVVVKNYQGPSYGMALLYVEDTLRALQDLSQWVLQQSKARVVGITGSLGKTSTKDFLSTILKEKYRVAASPGNSNSKIGLPLAILNHTNREDEIIILEMGMTHPGQISRLVEIAPPECAIITSAALVHACNFDSLESIADAKAEILTHPKTKIGILNRDLVNYEKISRTDNFQKISFAYIHPLADYSIQPHESPKLHVKVNGGIQELEIFSIPGKHQQVNFLAAVACARYFGLTWQEISCAMSRLILPPLRGSIVEKKGIFFINDSYNAAELSVKAALENLPQPLSGGRKIAVLSDMLELGKFSEACHKEIGRHSLKYVDQMFCYGSECRHIATCWEEAKRPIQWFAKREELLPELKNYLKTGDVVLIKGSRGTEIYKLLDELETLVL